MCIRDRGRYARFCSSAEGYAEVAEMHCYKGEEEIVPIDSWGDAPATVGTFAHQVYDNEPLSYFKMCIRDRFVYYLVAVFQFFLLPLLA